MQRSPVRLSQCMIVKNEENNIERALSWGKGYVAEQIVVDTGSTDNTAEIAERMGAKVYHYEWADDFSAAKNYAIEKATGNWIAFLDADEYFRPEEVKKMVEGIKDMEMDRTHYFHIARCTLSNINDDGKIIAVMQQDRIFRNIPDLRYCNRIHEQLYLKNGKKMNVADFTADIHIIHTGYAHSVYQKTGKTQRNIRLLEKELEADPDNYMMMSYLAESLMTEKKFQRSEELLKRILTEQPPNTDDLRRPSTCTALLRAMTLQEEWNRYDEFEKYFNLVLEELPDSPDPDYYMGIWLMNRQEWAGAAGHLECAIRKQEQYKRMTPTYASGAMADICKMLQDAYYEMGDNRKATQYGVFTLRLDKKNETALCRLLMILMGEPGESENAEGTFYFLEKLYDFSNLRDKLLIIKCAKCSQFYSLEDRMYDSLTADEKQLLKQLDEPDIALGDLEEKYGVVCHNMIDESFLRLLEKLEAGETNELVLDMVEAFEKWDWKVREGLVHYLDTLKVWGILDLGNYRYNAFSERIELLKQNKAKVCEVYKNLSDFQSKKVWAAILRNWICLDHQSLQDVKEPARNYYNPDIVCADGQGIVVDIGSYLGKSIKDYIGTYGQRYHKIYSYEITEEITDRLKSNLRKYDGVEVRKKALGKENGASYAAVNQENKALNKVVPIGEERVMVAAIDEDISDRIALICIDTGDMVLDILEGGKRHIMEEHPQLVVNVACGYSMMWEVMEKIRAIDGTYHFYLRHYAGNLIPSEYILYAV